jgi:hypothetical protein
MNEALLDIMEAEVAVLASGSAAELPVLARGCRLCRNAQVVSFLGYTGRAANEAATAESDPNETS